MKILAFAGSNSKHSINKKLVTWVADQFTFGDVCFLDLNDFEMPLFGVDREAEVGIPAMAYEFAKHIDRADLLIISLAEHNGAYSVAFKNIFDWVSRIPNRKMFADKPIFLMATSPGRRGGKTVLKIAADRFPRNGGKIIGTFSLPGFEANFSTEKGIVNPQYLQQILAEIERIQQLFPAPQNGLSQTLKIGDYAPPWEIESIFGDDVPDIAHFRGSPLMILFFNLGCPGCMGRAIPYANRIVYENKGIQVVGIHSSFEGPPITKSALVSAKDELYVRFPYFKDKADHQTFQKYGALGTPHWVIINADGRVEYSLFGSEPNNALMRLDLKIAEILQ